ncbi:MAG: MYXO-CTERM sorting domain-containing protein [Polyangia bacterium]|jgi:MYXO-CTERM domain-containing protein|nr:MYXO-CTERM sorting domain-containing protein [Polyangia bacterium]
MKQRKVRRWALGALVVFAFGFGCDSAGCDLLEPMPAGNEVPKNQTIEGGLQTRVTPGGFQKISSIIPGMLEDLLGNGITVIQESYNSWSGPGVGVEFWMCPGGCNVQVAIPPNGISVSANSATNMLLIDLTLQLQFVLNFRTKVELIGIDIADITCGVQIASWQEPLHFTVGIEPYIRAEDGELRLRLVRISNLELAGITFSIVNCGLVGDFLNTFMDYINQIFDWLDMILGNAITEFIVNQWILPLMQDWVDSLLPDPLGLEGQLDIGSLLSSFSPGAAGIVELRVTPGGYVNLLGNGMSLGVITGVNSDYDPTTRLTAMNEYNVREHSEGHPKMPPMPTADLSTLNGGLPVHPTRLTYTMAATTELSGLSDTTQLKYENPQSPLYGQTADIGLGVTESFLDLFGFHLLNSGALCLEVGTSEVSMLTVGLFSIMVNSLGDLVDPSVGDAPMRLVLRPQTPLEFELGNPYDANNPTPLLDLYLQDFQIDVYAFSEGRYVRAFTMALDMHIGLNLSSEVIDDTVYLKPAIESISSSDVTVRIHNSELISDRPQDLAVLFPSVLSMLMPMLTGALPDIALPELMGIKMQDIEFRSNVTQDILLILASLATPSPVPPQPAPVLPVRTRAELLEVRVPTPEALRASLLDPSVPAAEKNVPFVRIGVEAESVPPGRMVEWQYRLNGGAWRGFRTGPELVIRDETFYFQGWHKVEVRGRVAGSELTVERSPVAFDVLIDSVAPYQNPRIEDGTLHFGGFDFVTPRGELEYSYEFEPGRFSEWAKRGSLPIERARALAEAQGGTLRVRARDEAGNVSEGEIPTLVLGASPVALPVGGCGCAAEGQGGGGLALLAFGLLAILGLGKRRRRPFSRAGGRSALLVSLVALGAAATIVAPGCSKKAGGDPPDAGPPPCSDNDECAALQCEDGQLPLCISGRCQCVDDLTVGKVGPHSSHAESFDSIMVAAYNQRYGDLMFASIRKGDVGSNPVIKDEDFEFVDGVPWDNPPDVPTSEIRGGIRAKGDDVGRFTSIAADNDGKPVIAYYDLTHGSLKLARMEGLDWRILTVDDGGSSEGPEGGDAGRYTRISMRPSDRAPGIVYFVQHLPGSDELHLKTELRFAQSNVARPAGPGDFTTYTVDTLEIEVPTDEEGQPLEVDKWPLGDWPMGVGVTSSVARTSDGRPVVVYYDSVNGNLKASEFDGTAFVEPVILDGEDGGADTGNVGLFPSIRLSPDDDAVWHLSYMDVGLRQLLYLRAGEEPLREVVDHGLRQEENEITGLPMPVSHFVGFDSKIVLAGSKVFIAYQDGTNHELRWAERDPEAFGTPWFHSAIAGDVPPTLTPDGDYQYEGAFGFYIDLSNEGSNVAYLSTYAVNEWARSNLLGDPPVKYWVQIFAVLLGEG